MMYMDSLPNTSAVSPQTTVPAVSVPVGSMAKEVEPAAGAVEAPVMTEIGKETELAPEVRQAGVRMQADAIELPKVASQLGVRAVAPAASPVAVAAVALPLTDDQIAQGLQQSLVTSWRWLAEWCARQLKQAHILLRSVHGATERVKN